MITGSLGESKMCWNIREISSRFKFECPRQSNSSSSSLVSRRLIHVVSPSSTQAQGEIKQKGPNICRESSPDNRAIEAKEETRSGPEARSGRCQNDRRYMVI